MRWWSKIYYLTYRIRPTICLSLNKVIKIPTCLQQFTCRVTVLELTEQFVPTSGRNLSPVQNSLSKNLLQKDRGNNTVGMMAGLQLPHTILCAPHTFLDSPRLQWLLREEEEESFCSRMSGRFDFVALGRYRSLPSSQSRTTMWTYSTRSCSRFLSVKNPMPRTGHKMSTLSEHYLPLHPRLPPHSEAQVHTWYGDKKSYPNAPNHWVKLSCDVTEVRQQSRIQRKSKISIIKLSL